MKESRNFVLSAQEVLLAVLEYLVNHGRLKEEVQSEDDFRHTQIQTLDFKPIEYRFEVWRSEGMHGFIPAPEYPPKQIEEPEEKKLARYLRPENDATKG